MHQFVQSAIEAAKQGDNQKAMAFIKQVLNSNPNDVDAWLVLAAIVEDPQRKRQCLRRVLTLDPNNMVAREELEDMDRAETGGDMPPFISDAFGQTQPFDSTQDESAPVSNYSYQPESSSALYSTGASTFEPEGTPPPPPAQTKPQTQFPAKSPAKKTTEKKLVFKYPILWRIVLYIFVGVFGCVGLMAATESILISLLILGFAVLMGIGVWMLFPTVEISSNGIRVSGTFSSGEANWDEIVKIKSNAMKQRLELTKRNKQVVKVSTQVSGYPQIVEILQSRRPDLFGMAPRPQTQTSAFSSSNESGTPAYRSSASPTPAVPAFKGARTFKKSFFKQYGSYLIVIPLCLFATWTVLNDPQYRIGAGVTVFFCLVMLVLPLFQVSAVKVAGNKLTIETLFEEKTFSAKEIGEIKMQTVRGRYGRATNYVNILPLKGKNYPLEGFSEGDEIIFGILTNWWNANRH